MEYQELMDRLKNCNGIYLYGAGVVAYGAYKAIQELFSIKIIGFLVTEKDGQTGQIEGIPVQGLEDMASGNNNLIMIAAPEEYHDSMERALLERGICSYIRLDSHMEYVLMGQYLKKVCGLRLIEDCRTNVRSYGKNAGVYMAVSHKDKRLGTRYEEASFVKKIQVGTALTDQRIAELTDECCGGLSEQNTLYGELSATYYAWKYGTYDVTGIFHYRRVLKITEEQMQMVKDGALDAVLPLPFVCYPDASGQYGRYLLQSDVDIMLQVLRERHQDNSGIFGELLGRPYLYNYNMLVARREVFDDYCGWIFPLLQEITHRCEAEKRNRLPRYIGRIGEVLTSLYFMRNERKWKIAHAEKIWRV